MRSIGSQHPSGVRRLVSTLLGAADVRRIAEELEVRPTKKWGQNFVIDPNTVRRIVRVADVAPSDVVLEIGPGIGSLTLALLETGARVVAIEIDPRLAERLPRTVAEFAPDAVDRLDVICADAMDVSTLPVEPTAVVANLPYNVAVPVVLHLLATFPSIEKILVMVQREVADRMCAEPGSRTYGVPSVKARWFGHVHYAGDVGRNVFWPAPNVDSGLVSIVRGAEPAGVDRSEVFSIVDAAFAQRRKQLRSALSGRFPGRVDSVLASAGVDPSVRGEQLDVSDFIAIARAAASA